MDLSFSSWRMCSWTSLCFVSCGLCQVHLMYTNVAFKNSKDTGLWTCFKIFIVLENMCNSCHHQEGCSSSSSSSSLVPWSHFTLPLLFPILLNSSSPKGTIALWSPTCFVLFFSLFLPHILMSGVWFCIFLLVNCLQVQYADTNSSTSISKCNISTYSAESKLYYIV